MIVDTAPINVDPVSATKEVISTTMNSDDRRKREAADALVLDVVRGSDESVISSLRIALERGWREELKSSLKEAKDRKTRDIDNICNRKYNEFLTSVRDLLAMRETSAAQLTHLICDIHDNVSDTGKELLTVLQDLNGITYERAQVAHVLEMVLEFKNIIVLMNQARACIDHEDYYQAINIINTIDNVEKHKIAHIRPMINTLQQWLPVVNAKLLSAMRFDCDTMISTNRYNHSLLLGRTLLNKFAETSTARDLSEVYIGKPIARATQILADKVCTVPPSISLAYVIRYGTLLRLEKWTERGEFDASIPQAFIDIATEEGTTFLQQFAEKMPLAPLHKCLYAYQILGKIDQFYDHYRLNRDGILPVLFEEAEVNASNQGIASVLPMVICKIAGLFGMECLIRHSLDHCDGAFRWLEIHALWDKACGYLHSFISRHCDEMMFPDQVLQVKEELLMLAELVTDDLFGFRTHGLFETIRYLWNRFEILQLEYIKDSCQQALEHCAFQPFYIASEDIYNKKIKSFELDLFLEEDAGGGAHENFNDMKMNNSGVLSSGGRHHTTTMTLDELEEDLANSLRAASAGIALPSIENPFSLPNPQGVINPFAVNSDVMEPSFIPKTMPFSDAVPTIMRCIFVVITRFFICAARNPFLGSRGESVCRTVTEAYNAVGKVLIKELLVNGVETPLSKACQVSIDAAVFGKSFTVIARLLETMLKQFHWMDSLTSHLPQCTLLIQKNMQTISLQAQDMVFELLSRKIDDLLGSLVFIPFLPDFNQVVIGSHEPVDGIIEFLRITLMWLTHLPQSAREAAHFTCCTKVANGILEYLLSPKVTQVNYLCLACFAADARKLESFADECGIQHLKLCFGEFHELLKAMLHPDLSLLIDNIVMRRNLFPRLDSFKMCTLMEKMIPMPVGANIPGLPRPDKATLKTYVKKLKAQLAKS